MASAPFPNLTNGIQTVKTTGQISNPKNGAGIGEVGGKLYYNPDGSVGLFGDKVADTALNVGALASVTGLTVSEKGLGGFLHQTTFTLKDVPVTLLDAQNGKGTKFYDFPTGMVTILGSSGSVTEKTTSTLASTLNTGVTYNWGVGTATQANGTLATTEQDILPTTNGTASATINVAGAASVGSRTAAPAGFNGNSSAKSAYFNVGVATATDIDGDATTLWNGTITILWAFTGAF